MIVSSPPIREPDYPIAAYARHDEFFWRTRPATPCLLIDLDVVVDRYHRLRSALPEVEIYYAVKANPAAEVLRLVARLGGGFDVASPAEIDACLDAGADPARLSYGNTVKKEQAIGYAYERGLRLFAVDSPVELDKIARAAPGARVFCRVAIVTTGARWPLSRKFGCSPDAAVDLLRRADRLGLHPYGVMFHVGSQQLIPGNWTTAIRLVTGVRRRLAADGIELPLLNLGGGLPAQYDEEIPELAAYGAAIRAGLADGAGFDRLIIEPGRYLPGDAGLIRSEVVLVADRTEPELRRWVYLDIGRYGGLTETEGESIGYPVVATRPDGELSRRHVPVVLAGPTCDSTDVMYEVAQRPLPVDVRPGDHVDFLAAGAYTTQYASVGFNGFPPLTTFSFGGPPPPEG